MNYSGSGPIDELKAFEHSTLKVPYETLNKQYRNVQKAIDRDCSALSQSMSSFEKTAKALSDQPQQSSNGNTSEVTNSLRAVVDKLRTLKKRSIELRNDEKDLIRLIKRRLDHLKDYDVSNPISNKNFKKVRMDRMLIDYFLRSGFYQTAQLLASKSNIQDMTNIDVFLVEKEISDSLKNKETSKCLAWCNENKSKLKKINSNLEFTLRQQEFIELVKKQRCLDAVLHARKHFVNLTETQHRDVQKTMVLLAYAKNADCTTYQELMNEGRWDDIIELFKQENYKIHQLPEHSCFTAVLQAGLSALKTPTCYRKVTAVKNPNCPVCQPNFNVIARPLPYANCGNSKLICAHTGSIINENNIPMMLPNGYVYSYNALLKLMDENNGKVRCPRTGEVFDFNEAQKVFIL